MMRLRKFMVYLEDRDNCYRVEIPAKNEKEAREYVAGNGEVIAVKDVTDIYTISLDKVIDALRVSGFGDTEIAFINRTLQSTGIAE